jgi:hypothetical protein
MHGRARRFAIPHARRPDGRPTLGVISENIPEPISRILVFADKLKEAREAYHAEFSFAVTDKEADRQFAVLYSRALSEGREVVLPHEIALAFYLRPGGGGRTRGKIPESSISDKNRIMSEYRGRKAELIRVQHYRAGAAAEQSAREHATPEFPAEAILERDRRRDGHRRLRRRRAQT